MRRHPSFRIVVVGLCLAVTFTGSLEYARQASAAHDSIAELMNEVSPEGLMGTVLDLQGFGPKEGVMSRAFYLDTTLNVSIYIHDRLASLGLQVQYQTFDISGREVRNVIGVLNGTDPNADQLLFGAHYDSENYLVDNMTEACEPYGSAPGADDDASGVAAVLEMARVMHNTRLENTVKFVAFSAEEAGYDNSGGLAGSTRFAFSEKSAGVKYAATGIMDMIGYKSGDENVLTLVTKDASDPLAHSMASAVRTYGLNLTLVRHEDPAAAYSDHYPFWQSGYPSVLMIEELSPAGWPVNPYYHTANDTQATLSDDQMAMTTRAVLGGALMLLTSNEDGSEMILLALAVVVAMAVVLTVLVFRRRRVE